MSKPVGAEAEEPGGAIPSGDSPKPHGDKLASARPPGGTGVDRQADAGAIASGDSPKPHGDKLTSAGRRGAASTGAQDEPGGGGR